MSVMTDPTEYLIILQRLVKDAADHHRHKRWEQFHTALRSIGYASRDASISGYEEEQRLARLERLT